MKRSRGVIPSSRTIRPATIGRSEQAPHPGCTGIAHARERVDRLPCPRHQHVGRAGVSAGRTRGDADVRRFHLRNGAVRHADPATDALARGAEPCRWSRTLSLETASSTPSRVRGMGCRGSGCCFRTGRGWSVFGARPHILKGKMDDESWCGLSADRTRR